MTIIVGSQSAIEITAVQYALSARGIDAEVIGVNASSFGPEQPLNDETIERAKNRASDAKQLDPLGHVYIAIEHGLFEIGGRFFDKAVVVCTTNHPASNSCEQIAYSAGVEFPRASVEEARSRGFANTSVVNVMADQGLVAKHDDPYLTLTGKSRAQFLTETVSVALAGFSEKIAEQLSKKYNNSRVWLRDAGRDVTNYRNSIQQGRISGDDAREAISKLDDLSTAGAIYMNDLAELSKYARLARFILPQADKMLNDIREALDQIRSLTTEMEARQSVAPQSQRVTKGLGSPNKGPLPKGKGTDTPPPTKGIRPNRH